MSDTSPGPAKNEFPVWFRNRFEGKISWMEFNQNVAIDMKRKYLYMETAKVACSTIKSRLTKDLIGPLPGTKEVHPTVFASPFIKPFQLPDGLMRRILSTDDFYRFTYLREPVERVLSAYLDKIGRDTQQRKRFYAQHLPDVDPDEAISLELFLDTIAKLPNPRAYDKHWRPQSDLIMGDKVQYHFVGCFGRFEEDWAKIVEAIGLPKDETPVDIVWHATSASEKIDAHITPGIRKKIETLYAADFDLYNKVYESNAIT